ncbi:hypothetical protein ACFV5N_00955 [Streptomyces sp. NPDC059853]|uniref:WDGH domain-containing protein n=1 Tax=Streptomyces sp. NPDC059853 TaxID=3346973 RepID=UPI00364C40F1
MAVDFDGVVHSYTRGWADGSMYDPPVPGALDALRDLMTRYAVVIHTARDAGQVAEWLDGHGFECVLDDGRPFWSVQGQLLVTSRKLPSVAYVDDRAVLFRGDWAEALAIIETGEPAPTSAQLTAVYRERTHLLAHLAALYPSRLRDGGDPERPGWAVLDVELPTGQASWHIAPRDLDLLTHVPAGPGQWDGHSTAEKYERLEALTTTIANGGASG